MKKFVLLSLALVGLAGGSAHADAVSGPRVEILAGYDSASVSVSSATYSRSGVYYGFGAGYDIAVANSFSLGLDAEVGGSTAKYKYAPYTLSVGRDLYAGARATVEVSPKVSLFAKAGYANGQLKLSNGTAAVSANGNGFRAGVGAEYAITAKLYGSLEYRYTNYQDSFSRNQLLGGVGFHF